MRAPSSSFAEAAESFMRSRHNLRPWTRRSYAKGLARIAERCPTIADFTLDLINLYLAEKITAGHSTIAHHDGGLAKRLAAWLVQARILGQNPLDGLAVPAQPKRRRKPFTDVETLAILEAARGSCHSERDVTIVSLALACGLRKDEIRQLQWPDDVNLKTHTLEIRDTKTDAGRRLVPISPHVVTLLDIYVKDWRPAKSAGPLFLNNHGDAFSYDGFSQIFSRIKRRLPASMDFKAHRARNTALTNWRRAGVDIATLAKIAGHSDIAHTEHYLGDITPEEIARVPDAFGRILGRKAI